MFSITPRRSACDLQYDIFEKETFTIETVHSNSPPTIC